MGGNMEEMEAGGMKNNKATLKPSGNILQLENF